MTSLALELSASPKTDFRLAASLQKLLRADENELRLSVLFRTSAAIVRKGNDIYTEEGKTIEGVHVRASTESLYAAVISLKGLEKLINDPRVTAVEGPPPLKRTPEGP